MKKQKKGFTLVELMVVIAILAVLATVSVVGYGSFVEKAKKSNAETELHQIVTVLEAELMDDDEMTWTNAGTTYTLKRTAATTYEIVQTGTVVSLDDSAKVGKAIKLYEDLKGLKGNLSFDVSNGELTYTLNISDDTVTVTATLFD